MSTQPQPPGSNRQPPVIIAVAPNGAYKNRSDHPGLPLHAGDIADEAHRCMLSGASMLHLHVRDEEGNHTLDPGCYQRAIEAVRSRCGDGLLIQATTEAAGVYSQETQVKAIEKIEADFLSIAPVEILSQQRPSEIEAVRKMFQSLEERGTAVQYIIYEPAHFELLTHLGDLDVLPSCSQSLLFVLGRYRVDRQSNPSDLSPFLESNPFSQPWMACAFGQRELDCMVSAALAGGHARVGFENNLVSPSGRLLNNTAESVELLVSRLKLQNLRPATCCEARATLIDQATV